MAFLLILDREHKVLWVKNKNKPRDNNWLLPEVEDPVKKPSNRLNVELLAKQAFIPLKSSLVGKKSILDIFHNDQLLYFFLCTGSESSDVLFDLTKYRDIQWNPINCIKDLENYFLLPGKSIMDAYYDIFLDGFILKSKRFHIVKNGQSKKDVNNYNNLILQKGKRFLIELKDQYNLYHQPIPENGDYALLNNWQGIPVAILKITNVTIEPFGKINDIILDMHDSNDLPLDKLVKNYQNFFNKWCRNYNQKFSNQKPVILSQFKLVYQFSENKIGQLEIP